MKRSFTLTLTSLSFRCNLLMSIGCLKTCKIQSGITFVKRLSVKGKKKSSSFAFRCNLLISILRLVRSVYHFCEKTLKFNKGEEGVFFFFFSWLLLLLPVLLRRLHLLAYRRHAASTYYKHFSTYQFVFMLYLSVLLLLFLQ